MPPDGDDPIFSPIALPSGRILSNRLVKVALYEHLAKFFGGPPNRFHLELYRKWSAYDWGMIFTGNVQVSPEHICLARDLVLPSGFSEEQLKPFRELAAVMHGEQDEKPVAIMQLSHAGRQSPNILGGRFPFVPPLGPSSIRLGSSLKNNGIISELLHRVMFQIPRVMSLDDIDQVADAFVRGAKLAALTDYDGVELHVAHGYLLAQFMSPKSNVRTDEYSCSPSNALRLLNRIVLAIRAAVPPNFILGLKINAADYAESEITGEASSLDHIRTIAGWGLVDFIEISGGDYEKPDFMTTSTSPSARQTIFAEFSTHALRVVESIPRAPLILLTGGLTAPAQLYSALSFRHTHLLGLGRSAVLCPDLPQLLKERPSNGLFAPQPDLSIGTSALGDFVFARLPRIRLLGAGVAMAWYIVALRRLTSGTASVRPDYAVSGFGGLFWMWAWFGPEVSAFSRFRTMLALTICVVGASLLVLGRDLKFFARTGIV
ncbi:hypothetical protein DFH07DRAFT_787334 [Mycena maculata]|uniref:NADH:flavin oxidoreductase/NADH oxidase N-terminal domain-containing protein n=1 Tax=Mycena maculata TaxID=230809 RepID=A0AAD7P2U8_9AGAR|nr:hypothetical protein DFH07DRAFT_787334 [Mycena maculata]